MPTREEIDAQLLKYLREQETRERRQEEWRKREDEGVKTHLANITSQVQLLGQKLDSQNTLMSERLAGLSARIDKLEEDVEDTGVHNLDRLREERDAALKKADDANKETKETKGEFRKYAAAAVIALLSGGGAVELLHQIVKGH